MTKKRFMIDNAGELIDLNNAKFVDYGDEVCDLLNQLTEENEQLKKENKELEYTLSYVNKEKQRIKEFFDD